MNIYIMCMIGYWKGQAEICVWKDIINPFEAPNEICIRCLSLSF